MGLFNRTKYLHSSQAKKGKEESRQSEKPPVLDMPLIPPKPEEPKGFSPQCIPKTEEVLEDLKDSIGMSTAVGVVVALTGGGAAAAITATAGSKVLDTLGKEAGKFMKCVDENEAKYEKDLHAHEQGKIKAQKDFEQASLGYIKHKQGYSAQEFEFPEVFEEYPGFRAPNSSIFNFNMNSLLTFSMHLPTQSLSLTPLNQQMRQFEENLKIFREQQQAQEFIASQKPVFTPLMESKPVEPPKVVEPPKPATPFLDRWNRSTKEEREAHCRHVSDIVGKKLGCTLTWWEYESMMKQNLDPSDINSLRYVERSVLCPNGGAGPEASQGRTYPGTRIGFSGNESAPGASSGDNFRSGGNITEICSLNERGDKNWCVKF